MAAENVTIRGAKLLFRNFSGNPDKFQPAGGRRNFCVRLSPEQAEQLSRAGWNVKTRDPREEGDDPLHYIKVNIQYNTKGRPPRIVQVTQTRKTALRESNIELLDWADITSADLTFRAYEYEPGSNSAYLVTLFVNIVEDELEAAYADIPETGTSPVEHSFEDGPRFE